MYLRKHNFPDASPRSRKDVPRPVEPQKLAAILPHLPKRNSGTGPAPSQTYQLCCSSPDRLYDLMPIYFLRYIRYWECGTIVLDMMEAPAVASQVYHEVRCLAFSRLTWQQVSLEESSFSYSEGSNIVPSHGMIELNNQMWYGFWGLIPSGIGASAPHHTPAKAKSGDVLVG